MDTVVYIDGYNLFYGRLRNTPYKWLDLYQLAVQIIKAQNPISNIVKVKYFTAPVKANFASHGRDSVSAQNAYHNALKHLYSQKIEIINGFHTVERGFPPKYQQPINKDDRVEVWKFEEKQTDVNIALAMYKDALQNNIKQQVLISNDSDLEPVLRLINADMSHIELGLIIPKPKPLNQLKARPANKGVSQYANWTRKYILDEECKKALLADVVPTHKKPIYKPTHW